MLHPTISLTPGMVISLTGGPEIRHAQVVADLDNMTAALARHHGEKAARLMLAEAFAEHFARWAQEAGNPISARFALEIALDNAQRRAVVTVPMPSAAPGGSAA